MSDNTVPTQPYREPNNSTQQDTVPQTPAGTGPGHWYNYPGQQPLAPPPPMPGTPTPTPYPVRDRGRHSARERVRRRKVRREIGAPDDWAWVIIAAALLGMTVVMSMFIFFGLQATRGSSGTQKTSVPPVEPTSVIYGPGGILEGTGVANTGGMLGGESMIINPWDGKERFTVLLMGMDRRPGEMGGSIRTDTMMLISLDPDTKQIGILSIPRDLWVDMPGYDLQRINTAYGLGELQGPGGGPLLAMQMVQYNFGIEVNEYLVVDFDAFIQVIDLIGGVDVNVEQEIYDPEYPDMNYGYDPFYISAGQHHLDGATALKYARSRHSTDDIDRAHRQQQVIYAVRDRVLALNMIPELVAKAPQLWSELDAGIDTGLSLDQIIQLVWYAKDIPTSNIKSDVLGWEYVIPTTYNGMSILLPNRFNMGELMLQVFGPGYGE